MKKESKNKAVSIEVDGATLGEAIDKAVKILGVPKEMINIKLLSEEEKGLFGMQGAQLAKIRASIKSETEKKKPAK